MPLLIFFKADIVANCIKLRKISYFQLFSSCFGPKIHDFLPPFAPFKPDFHVPREILSYRKKNHVNRNNITVATAASVLQLLEVQIGGSNSLIIHQPQSSCMRNDQFFVTVRWLCMNTSIWVNTSPKSLGNHLYWHYGRNTKTAVKALMLFGLTCLIHQNALEFHEEHTGESAHARGR